jgi:hypothetical protein
LLSFWHGATVKGKGGAIQDGTIEAEIWRESNSRLVKSFIIRSVAPSSLADQQKYDSR